MMKIPMTRWVIIIHFSWSMYNVKKKFQTIFDAHWLTHSIYNPYISRRS